MRTRAIGPEVEGCDGGVYQQVELLDPLTHLNPYKRPPPIVWKKIKEGYHLEKDISEQRPPIPQTFPGRHIGLAKNGYPRDACAILFNGESLKNHNLHDIPFPTIGMNRTITGYPGYEGPTPTYYCLIDRPWLEKEEVINHPRVLNASTDSRDIGFRITKSWRMKPFSFDLGWDGAVPVTTGYVALQAAVYMGFKRIYCLGLDEGNRDHFDGTKCGSGLQKQPEYMLKAAPLLKDRGVEVFLCGSPNSACTAFPHISFDEAIRG